MRKKMLGLMAAGIAFFMTVPSAAFAAGTNELARGEKNASVIELQQILKDKGYYTSDITGYYGAETEQAVTVYQQKNGLNPDGKVGPETSQALFGEDYTTILASLSKKGSKPMLSPGDSGENIVLLQKRLQQLDYYDYNTLTGFYGPLTQEAVEKFQQSSNLQATGTADEKTLSALYSQDASPYTMALGDNGSDIQKLQSRLDELGYFNTDTTGYYGEMTRAAVEQFQKANNLPVDGKAGLQTRKLLFSAEAAAYPGGDTPSSLQDVGTISKSSVINNAVSLAYDLLGKDYIYGTSGPNSFDCSGFIFYILSNAGLPVNKMSPAAFSTLGGWQTVSNIESLEIGDIVFFKADNSNSINHMGIYAGGGSFIHASQNAGGVTINSMTSGYYNRNFVTARRIS
ncbi:MAG: peptidoglycan-binding protein [Eubacteriales bacterium]